ncbi:hypothetical protein ACHAWF_008795 [Thalassiosira exigua]
MNAGAVRKRAGSRLTGRLTIFISFRPRRDFIELSKDKAVTDTKHHRLNMKIVHFLAALAGFKTGIAMAHNEHLRKHPDVAVQDASIVREVAVVSDVQREADEALVDLMKNGGSLAKANLSDGGDQGGYTTPMCGHYSGDECWCCNGYCSSDCCKHYSDWSQSDGHKSCREPACPELYCRGGEGTPFLWQLPWQHPWRCATKSDPICQDIENRCEAVQEYQKICDVQNYKEEERAAEYETYNQEVAKDGCHACDIDTLQAQVHPRVPGDYSGFGVVCYETIRKCVTCSSYRNFQEDRWREFCEPSYEAEALN